MMTWNYTNIRSSTSPSSWEAISSVQRDAVQALGRPWTRMAPTIGAITKTFADKENDSRYDGTFTTTYRANYQKAGISGDRKSTRLNSSHVAISYAGFCLKKKIR